jgi:Tfp pilus assembly protein PilF
VNAESTNHLDQARALDRAGKRERAIECYRAFLEGHPEDAGAWADLAGVLMAEGHLAEAESACGRALALAPGHFSALVNQACVLMQQGRLAEAEPAFQRAMTLFPDRSEVRLLHSDCLARKGDLDQARRTLEAITAREPGNIEALDRLNTLFVRQGDWACLRKDMERQVARHSGPEAEYVRGHLDLLFGDMTEGWRRYEARLEIPDRPLANRGFTQPRWQGEPFPGRTLLVNWEQGFGDTLMFLRYLPMVKALGGRVVLEVQPPLEGLAATCAGVDEVVPHGRPLPPFDLHVPLLSLPFVFRTTLDTVPASIPYLDIPKAVPARREIDQALAGGAGRTRVGVIWAGNPGQARDSRRSIPAAQLAPLRALPGVAWYSFQFEAKEEPPLPGLVTLGALLRGFTNTAYALAGMDLLIAADTVLAHMAGAFGIPTLLLLPFMPDWRWMMGRADTPWYPSMRLFRQPVPGDWRAVFLQVVRELAAG